ncbi:MAG: GNAT family N-acetyltransferase [Dehalococcoidia bacterium]
MHIETIDPTRETAWDEFLERTPQATVFHTSGWARVLSETYRFTPRYVVARNNGHINAGIPLFEVGGGRLVGLPFSDLSPPLLGAGSRVALLAATKQLIAERGSPAIELRGGAQIDLEAQGFQKGEAFYHHVIALDGTIDELETRWHPSARRAIRKSERAGVTVRESTSLDDMRAFYELHSLTRKKKHGLIPQPWSFIENIHRQHIAEGPGCILLAEHDGKAIAADVLLGFKDTLVYKFNASDPAYLEMRPNNLLLRRAIELGIERGYAWLDLGRCDADAEGLRRFKLLWGSIERPLHYFYYPSYAASAPLPGSTNVKRRLLGLSVRYAPAWALQRASAALYRSFA